MSFHDPSLPRAGHSGPGAPSSAQSGRGSSPTDLPRRRANARGGDELPPVQRPRGAPYRRSVDWEHVALVGTGLLIGAALGVGATLLFAPGSGLETRSAIRRHARVAGHRATDAFGELADELAAVARRGRRRAQRALRRARWRASDVIA